jgi:mannan endo-1,4-beta-mannosidase
VQKINSHKVPWLYWEPISNADPHQGEDYEVRILALHCEAALTCMPMQIQVNGADWSTLASASKATAALTSAPFDFSASLAL